MGKAKNIASFIKDSVKKVKKSRTKSIPRDSRGHPKRLRDRKLTEEEKMQIAAAGGLAAMTYPASKMLMDQNQRGKDARNKRDRDAKKNKKYTPSNRQAKKGFGIEKK